jgi:hypothetical protein
MTISLVDDESQLDSSSLLIQVGCFPTIDWLLLCLFAARTSYYLVIQFAMHESDSRKPSQLALPAIRDLGKIETRPPALNTYCNPCCPIAPFFGSILTIVGISFDIADLLF